MGLFKLNTRGNFLTVRYVGLWNNLPREMVNIPSLGIFKIRLEKSARQYVIANHLAFSEVHRLDGLNWSFPSLILKSHCRWHSYSSGLNCALAFQAMKHQLFCTKPKLAVYQVVHSNDELKPFISARLAFKVRHGN